MNQTTIELIERIIFGVTAFYVPREGVVLKNQDDEGLGRILVSIPSLGWDTEDKATWCFPKQVNSISTPGIAPSSGVAATGERRFCPTASS